MQPKLIQLSLIAGALFANCTKIGNSTLSASLTIVNGINNSNTIVTDFEAIGPKGGYLTTLQYYATATQIPYATSWESGSYVGTVSLSLFQFPDSSVAFWEGTLMLQPGSIHSLFLSGDTSSIDTLLTTDIVPYYPVADSVVGIRFVNLAKGSPPMSVNLQGNLPTITEFSSLTYQQMSSFKQYSANSNDPGQYNFEIRDQASGNLIYTFSWSYTPFKNNTAAIIGSEDPTSPTPIQVVQINNF